MEVPVEDGGSVLVEVDPPLDAVRASRSSRIVVTASETLEESLDRVKCIAEKVIDRFSKLSKRPDVVKVELGVKLSAELGVVLAKTCADAHLVLGLEWHSDVAEK